MQFLPLLAAAEVSNLMTTIMEWATNLKLRRSSGAVPKTQHTRAILLAISGTRTSAYVLSDCWLH